ncbi:Predicted membrane protein [Chryseobacterium nakagawai]|uniref:DUF805 domain-containing protein n=1 Tax=Chryseobacterium nakagawai TaxID=1241982 RepID=A0AAD1DRB7_CHRNA|nr:DUF805 domain-containing protein [Chryseobacterium nakagawai]AZA90709.1 DUF805 domain-containing protein [Chryseobacterium nakagawai]VEH22233.1 Predicted membrane protein [Chryseobacterium nakagawai]
MFKSPFSFDGRIRRTEYGLSYLIYLVFYVPFNIYFQLNQEPSEMVMMLFFILLIPSLWFLLAQGAKRCHDRGNSGWFQLIPFYSLWMLFADSDHGPNEYGPNPKGEGNYNAINEIGKKEI